MESTTQLGRPLEGRVAVVTGGSRGKWLQELRNQARLDNKQELVLALLENLAGEVLLL